MLNIVYAFNVKFKNIVKLFLKKVTFLLQYMQIIGPSDLEIIREYKKRQSEHPNPLCRYGAFGFSQSDEDGITLEILRRLDIQTGVFCEFGVGNGSENNTLILLAKGWTGAWIGGQELCFDVSSSSRLVFKKEWITKENIFNIYTKIFDVGSKINVVSLDLDGNDLYLINELLNKNVKPDLFIIEYNAIFLPEIEFSIDYDHDHKWNNDDYFGVSLSSLKKLLNEFDYELVCCNAATGSNAFFVKKESYGKFSDAPKEIANIYAEPFYYLPKKIGHSHSIKTLRKITH